MEELTRAELVEMICPTSATYECCQGDCSTSCDKCEDVMNYLLDRYDSKIKADERINTVQFIIDEFNRRTVCLGRAIARTYVINTLNEILNELKEQK